MATGRRWPIRTRPDRLTLLASALMLAVTVPFALAAWSLWQTGTGPLDAGTYQRIAGGMDAGWGEAFGRPLGREDARFWLLSAAGLLGSLCAWTTGLAVGVGLRREAPRHAAIVTFLLFALIAVPHGVGGWFLSPRPQGLAVATLTAVGTATILWLLATGRVADDIARATFYRQRRRRPPEQEDPSTGGRDWGDPPVLAA